MARHTTETCPDRSVLTFYPRMRIYELMDAFLTEGDKPRSLARLNQDRKLFVQEMNELIDQILNKAYLRWKEIK